MGRHLPQFVMLERERLMGQLETAALGHEVVLETVLRPRDRQPRPAVLRIRRSGGEGSLELEWLLEVANPPFGIRRGASNQ